MWYIYHINEETHSPKKVTINGVEVEGDSYISNPYRKGGILIYKSKFTQALTEKENTIEVY